MKKNLVIVESPAKARTLTKILGKGYIIKASMGHVRDLPKSRLGVDIDNGFMPKYVVARDKNKIVTEFKKAAKTASAVYLATDPDREGEAIAWHLSEVTKSNQKPFRRVVFHEITETAIQQAFKHPRSINMQLVNAQQARRILDRLVGYKLSPLLWRKVRKGLSAGRVQSVALRIIVDREREIKQFVPGEYWTVEAELAKQTPPEKTSFRTAFIGLFDGKKLDMHNQKEADTIYQELKRAGYSVTKVSTKKVARQPAPPFITSTLQQEAWRKLRFTATRTMVIAQQLYEGLPVGSEGNVGLITYMRTDSTSVARSAVVQTREFINDKYGSEYVPPHARTFIRTAKGAQEAHEAIRPTSIRREPHLVKPFLNTAQLKLYELIWQRMVASQMTAALFNNTNVDLKAKSQDSGISYLLRTSSSVNHFPGFLILYSEGKDEVDTESRRGPGLPKLEKGDKLKLQELFQEQRFTQPPHHFTEATLIKMLEQWGIGRPSTYAPTLSTIQYREYVSKTGGSLRPTELGVVVNDILCQHFADIVDVKFTARMEDELDAIASENRDWADVVKDFYTPFEKSLSAAAERTERVKLTDEITDELCPKCGKNLVVKVGRFGKFLACSGYPDCKYTKSFQIKTGVNCPECGKELVKRANKKKRTFYGCSNFPDCEFITNYQPLPQPCPQCGRLLTLYRQKWEKCVKCNYKDKLPEPETPIVTKQA